MKIKNFIKTDCGLEKYKKLSKKKGIIAKFRLSCFVFFAAIRDWNIKLEEHHEKSESWKILFNAEFRIKTINNVDTMPMMLIKENPKDSWLESISLKRTISPAKDPKPQKRIVPGIIAKRP